MLTCSDAARSRAPGRRSPGRTLPSAIPRRTLAAICSASGVLRAGSTRINTSTAPRRDRGQQPGGGLGVVDGDRQPRPGAARDDERLPRAQDDAPAAGYDTVAPAAELHGGDVGDGHRLDVLGRDVHPGPPEHAEPD